MTKVAIRANAEYDLVGTDEFRHFRDELMQRYPALIDGAFAEVLPSPGAGETLEAAFRNGWSIGIVTSIVGIRRIEIVLRRQD